MGFRYRKQIGSKGLKLNISKKGYSSTSFKIAKGITYNTKRGLTIGIPGTGISYNFGKKKTRKSLKPSNNLNDLKNIGSNSSPSVKPTEESFVPPTQRQLAYAKDLRIIIPENVSRKDLSCLIDRVVNNDSDPNPGLIEYANGKGILFSQYIGKKSLYNLIFDSLNTEDKAAFFAFAIYRWVSDDRHANLDTHPNREVFYQFVETVKINISFQKSLNRYSGEDLRFFGTINVDNSGTIFQYTGGSNGTFAYKIASEFLRDRFNTPLTRSKTFKTDKLMDRRDNFSSLDKERQAKREQLETQLRAQKEYNKGWRESTGGYSKKAMIAIAICLVLLFTPAWPIGLLLAVPSLLWFIIDTSVKLVKYNKQSKETNLNK